MTVKWGLIGASDIAETRMIPAMRARGQEVRAVFSNSSSRAADFASSNDIELGTTDLDTLLGADVDAVYVSSTNALHFEQGKAVLAAGKHLLIEKPVALDAEEAAWLARIGRDLGLVVGTNHHLRCAGLHRRARDLVAVGAVGELLGVRVSHAVMLPERLRGWRVDPDVPGCGVILDITVHDADTIRFITGSEFTSVSAAGTGPHAAKGVVDAVMTAGTLAGGALVQTYDAFTVAHNVTSVEVHGTDGSLFLNNAMTQDPVGKIHLHRGGAVTTLSPVDADDLYQISVQRFAEAVNGVGRPAADARDGLASLLVGLAAQEAVKTGRRIPVPDVDQFLARGVQTAPQAAAQAGDRYPRFP